MPQTEIQMRQLYTELQPGDRVKVIHEVKVGSNIWPTTTEGEVVRTERRRHSLHFNRNSDDQVWSDIIVMSRADGELTTVTIDEFTELEKL
jgi:hypothetical protein